MRIPERAVGSLLLVIGLAAGAVVCARGNNAASVPGGPADGTRIVDPRATGRAVIHVYSLKRFLLLGKLDVVVDGMRVARTRVGRVFDLAVTPGRHTLHIDRPENAVTIEVADGERQYVRFTPNRIRWGKAWVRVELVPPATATPEVQSLSRSADDLTSPAPRAAAEPWRLTPFRYLLLLALVAFSVAGLVRAYSGPKDPAPGFTSVLLFVATCVLGFIPAPFVFEWLPAGVLVGLLAFAVALAGGAFVVFKGPLGATRADALVYMGLVFVAAFYVGLLPAWALWKWAPGLPTAVSGLGLLRGTGLAVLVAADIGLNIFVAVRMEALRDLSGAYEKSTRAHWVTRDGKHYMDAKKWQTGEWSPPVRTGAKLLFLNAFFASAAAYGLYRLGWLSPTPLLLAYSALMLLASLIMALRRGPS